MTADPELTAHQAELVAQGRLLPAKDPDRLLKAESIDRGISAKEIDAAVSEQREDRS